MAFIFAPEEKPNTTKQRGKPTEVNADSETASAAAPEVQSC